MKHIRLPWFLSTDYTQYNIMSNNDVPSEDSSYPDFTQLLSILLENQNPSTDRAEERGLSDVSNDIVDEVFGELDFTPTERPEYPAETGFCYPDDFDCESSSPSSSIEKEQYSPASQSEELEASAKPKRRYRRERRKPLESKTLLAKSLMEWLEDRRYNPSAIKWISKSEGLFQITDSIAIANLWGDMKGNKNMTHEKLSRALRHYYKDGTLERIDGKKKLYYKFSDSAMAKFKLKL